MVTKEKKEPSFLNTYFNDFPNYSVKGRGLAIFDCDMQTVASVRELARGKVQENTRDGGHLDLAFDRDKGSLVIIENEKILDKNACDMASKILQPLYNNRMPFIFLSVPPLEKLMVESITFEDSGVWELELAKEQILNLLKRSAYIFSRPQDLLGGSGQKIFLTPIEEIMDGALSVAPGLEYRPQVPIGRRTVDFLVEKGGCKVIVECDGRDFHSAEKDVQRDKELESQGYEVLHFSGSRIWNDIDACIIDIERALSHMQKQRKSATLDDNLDPSQSRAVVELCSGARVLAPAGSGKTKTLVNRVIHLVNQGIEQGSILALAFNKKAAEEMKERLVAAGLSEVNVRTFNSFGYQITRKELGDWEFIESQQGPFRSILREVIDRLEIKLTWKINQDPLDEFLRGVSRAKADLGPQAHIDLDPEKAPVEFPPIWREFLKEQIKVRKYNFDDQIYLAVRILLSNPALRNRLQNSYRYVLIDEFQDLSRAQLTLAKLVSLPECNLFVVGDDDQTIYTWRGARIEHLHTFSEDYPASATHTLSTNYRCTKLVVHHSSRLISHNQRRVMKSIMPRENAEVGVFEIYMSEGIQDEAEAVAGRILKLRKETGCEWNEIAVLYRYKALQLPLVLEMDNKSIPHPPLLGENIFRSPAGKCLLGYLRMAMGRKETAGEDIFSTINMPNRYIGSVRRNKIREDVDPLQLIRKPPQGWKKHEYENIEKYLDDVSKLRDLIKSGKNTREVLSYIMNELGVGEEISKIDERRKGEVDEASQLQRASIIMELAKRLSRPEAFVEYAEDIIARKPEDDETYEQDNRESVRMYTIHRTKGKEYSHVFLFNLSESRALARDADMEEERRIVYVGMTRALSRLFITTSSAEVSQFVREMLFEPTFSDRSLDALKADLNKFAKKLQEGRESMKRWSGWKSKTEEAWGRWRELHGQYDGHVSNLKAWQEYEIPKPDGLFRRVKEKLFGSEEKTKKSENIAKYKNELARISMEMKSIEDSTKWKGSPIEEGDSGFKLRIEQCDEKQAALESQVKLLSDSIDMLDIELYWREALSSEKKGWLGVENTLIVYR